MKSTLENFISDSQKMYGNRFNYDITRKTFVTKKKPLKMFCTLPLHGEFTIKTPSNHLKPNCISGCCPKCKQNPSDIPSFDNSEGVNKFIENSVTRFGPDRFNYDIARTTFKMTKKPFQLYCNIHNHTFTINNASNHTKTECGGCDKCRDLSFKNAVTKKATKKQKTTNTPSDQESVVTPLIKTETKIRKFTDFSETQINDAKNILLDSRGECDSCIEEGTCLPCRKIITRIIDCDFVDYCKWIVPESKVICGSFLKQDQNVCLKHLSVYTDHINGIVRCTRHGCNEILPNTETGYCDSCKTNMRDTSRSINIEKRLDNVKRHREEYVVPESFRKWMAGFFDGDGYVQLQNFDLSGYNLAISFWQTDVKVLSKILWYYPTDIQYLDTRDNEICKPGFIIKYNGHKAEVIIDDLIEFSILKKPQLLLAKEFLPYIKLRNESEKKQWFFEKIRDLKHTYHQVPIDSNKLHPEYIAGLFDAEGCVILPPTGTHCLDLCQKGSPDILNAIALKYNGIVCQYSVRWYSNIAITNIVKYIEPYLTVKQIQATAMIDYLKGNRKDRDVYSAIIYNEKYRTRPGKLYMPVPNLPLLQKYEQLSLQTYTIRGTQTYKKLKSNEKNIEANVESAVCDLTKLIESLKSFKDRFLEAMSWTTEQVAENDKRYMLETKLPNVHTAYYESLIYNCESFNPKTFGVEIIPVYGSKDTNYTLWSWLHLYTASYKTSTSLGRRMRYLVKETSSKQYIGIMCLGSDVLQYTARDKEIGWKLDENYTNQRLNNIANIMACIPLQPFGFNFNGGKLIAMLCFSEEVLSAYEKQYNNDTIAALTTFSLKPKSPMYERTYLKHIGNTKGSNFTRIPERFYHEGVDLIKQSGKESILGNKDATQWRSRRTTAILKFLGINTNVLKENIQRGVYIGYTNKKEQCLKYLTNKSPTPFIRNSKPASEITREWLNRWAIKRSAALKDDGTFKYCDEYRHYLHFQTKEIMIEREKDLWTKTL